MKINIKLLVLSFIFIIIMYCLFIVRFLTSGLNILFNLTDLLWVFSFTLLIGALIFFKSKKYNIFLFVPLLIAISSELFQKFNNKIYLNNILNYTLNGTYDILDIVYYLLGFVLAIIFLLIYKKLHKKDLELYKL